MPDRASLLGGADQLKGKDMKALGKQADALWKMLDEMAESDPAAYRTFLQQQAEAAATEKQEEAAAAVIRVVWLLPLPSPASSSSSSSPSSIT